MITLHVENRVHDYDTWKQAFDRFDRARADNGVRTLRVSRDVADPSRVTIDLDFDTQDEAVAFRGFLEKVWATPQSQRELAGHAAPRLLHLSEQRSLSRPEVRPPGGP